MKTLLNDAMMAISAIPELKWVDDNLGQLNLEKPPVNYPCALVGIGSINQAEYTGAGQYGEFILEITIAHTPVTVENSAVSPEKIHPLAETIYMLIQKIDNVIHELEGEQYSSLSRTKIVSDLNHYPARFILSYTTVLYE